jgi:hypothetical protein
LGERIPVPPILRILGIAVAAVACVSWTIYATIAGDFNEAGLLLLGFLSFAFLLALRWKAKFLLWRLMAVIVAAALLLISGLGLIAFGRFEAACNTAISRTALIEVADALLGYSKSGGDLPDCAWPCMAETVMKAGAFAGIDVFDEEGKAARHFDKIPAKDGWGCRYRYRKISGDSFILESSGADRRFGTADDIIVTSSLIAVQTRGKLPVWKGYITLLFDRE